MKTRILGIVLITALFISSSAFAQNQERRKGPSNQKEMMMKKRQQMKKQFENFFTEEQREKMKELRLASAKEIKPIKNELNELRAKQRTLTTAEKADLNSINKNIDQMSKLQADMKKIMAKQDQEIRAMLNDEQLLKYDAMKERRGRGKGGFQGKQSERMGMHQRTRGA